LNLVTRPAGGWFGDLIYRRFGVPGKKYLTLFLAGTQGLVSIGIGAYIQNNTDGTYVAATGAHTGNRPQLPTLMGLVALLAVLNEMANGANFALVPHCVRLLYLLQLC
jgi:NNP family nitrate/nitrite transporter-like MFS transporter